jgi:TonB family protein
MRGSAISAVLILASFCSLAQAQVYRYRPLHLEYQVRPVYPELAKTARIQGVVRLRVRIGITGRVEDVQLISGHPFLVKAAMDAVRQWRYSPARNDAYRMSTTTTVDVNFTLNQDDDPPVTWV